VAENLPRKTELYEVICVLGKKIRTRQRYFEFITEYKHSELKGRLKDVLLTIKEADEARRSDKRPELYLYYRKFGQYWICAVTRHLNGEGFIITAYLTKKPKKKGVKIWERTE
jgi:hypothetical protein